MLGEGTHRSDRSRNAIYLVNILVLGNYYLGSSHVLLKGQRQLQALDTFSLLTDVYEDM